MHNIAEPKHKYYGEGTFIAAGGTLRNRLLQEVRNKPTLETFKSLVKTE
jgi:hypothetical protein